MKTSYLSTHAVIGYRSLYLAILAITIFFVATILTPDRASALMCEDIAASQHYCDIANDIDKGPFIPASGGIKTKRDPAKRIALINQLKARQIGNTYGFGVAPAAPSALLADELDDLEDTGDISLSTLLFLAELEDLMDNESTHKGELLLILNVSKSLSLQSSASLRMQGLDKQKIAEVLYHVVLKYLIGVMPTVQSNNTNEHDAAFDLFAEEDDAEGEEATEEEEEITDEDDDELMEVLEEIFGE